MRELIQGMRLRIKWCQSNDGHSGLRKRTAKIRLSFERLESRRLIAFGYDPLYGTCVWLQSDASDVSKNDFTHASALQTDQKLVVGGVDGTPASAQKQFKIERHKTTGFLDITFGGEGTATVLFTDTFDGQSIALRSTAYATEIQSDGKIIAVGNAPQFFGIARLNSNGKLDGSFSGDGKVHHKLGLCSSRYCSM